LIFRAHGVSWISETEKNVRGLRKERGVNESVGACRRLPEL
jgi:hypothetical protein